MTSIVQNGTAGERPARVGAPAAVAGERGWLAVTVVVAVLALTPLATLALVATEPATGIWQHLVTTILPRAVSTTFWLMLGVGVVVAVLGVPTAWIVTMYEFPGRRLAEWTLLLPLAVPTYIAAYAMIEFADYTGPPQTFIRWMFGYTLRREYWFPEVRSLGGAIFVMGFVLYPYVYLSARAAFLMQSSCMLEAARTLGAGPLRLFVRVGLPLARPGIVVGLMLALMECLNDIGAVQFFGVRTLTFAVYDTWLNRGSLAGAAQIAAAMLAIVFLLMYVERRARRDRRFAAVQTRMRPLSRRPLSGGGAAAAAAFCALPIVLGFVVPAIALAQAALPRLDQVLDPELGRAALHSLVLAVIAALVTVVAGTAIALALRIRPDPATRVAARIAAIGYAVPGTVLAVGILVPLARFDNAVDGMARELLGISTGLLLSGSGAALVYAYMTRFLTISLATVETGLGKLSPHLDLAARTLGRTATGTARSIHLPLLRPALATALLLVFVDSMKELSATILLRPFNFETLATTVFSAAAREQYEDGALAAIAIVLVGLAPVIFLARTGSRGAAEPEVERRPD